LTTSSLKLFGAGQEGDITIKNARWIRKRYFRKAGNRAWIFFAVYGIRFIFHANENYRLQSDRIFYIVLIEKYHQESLYGE